MTIHDPTTEVTCDGEDCDKTIFIGMTYTVGGYNENSGEIADNGWKTIGDKHFCEGCQED